MSRTRSADYAREIWDSLARDFTPAPLTGVEANGTRMFKLQLTPGDLECGVLIRLNCGLMAIPRFAAYRHRMVLLPRDALTGNGRWELSQKDILAMLTWSREAGHVITYSTLKSGASAPLSVHAQSFPRHTAGGESVASPTRAVKERMIAPGEMPRFESIEISGLPKYPHPGICLTGADHEVAAKIFELGCNWDGMKAFNLVIAPPDEDETLQAFMFPRRRDGRAVFKRGKIRWQVAALEMCGLLQCRTPEIFEAMDSGMMEELFSTIRIEPQEMEQFLSLLETF